MTWTSLHNLEDWCSQSCGRRLVAVVKDTRSLAPQSPTRRLPISTSAQGQNDSLVPPTLRSNHRKFIKFSALLSPPTHKFCKRAAVRTVPPCPKDPRDASSAGRYAKLARLLHDRKLRLLSSGKSVATKPSLNATLVYGEARNVQAIGPHNHSFSINSIRRLNGRN